jgi:hypothetical protein
MRRQNTGLLAGSELCLVFFPSSLPRRPPIGVSTPPASERVLAPWLPV